MSNGCKIFESRFWQHRQVVSVQGQNPQSFQTPQRCRFQTLQFIVTQNQCRQLRQIRKSFVFQNENSIIAQIAENKIYKN